MPINWDEVGKVSAVALSANTEDEHLSDENYTGRESQHFIREDVEVSGAVRECEDKKVITTQKYILKEM